MTDAKASTVLCEDCGAEVPQVPGVGRLRRRCKGRCAGAEGKRVLLRGRDVMALWLLANAKALPPSDASASDVARLVRVHCATWDVEPPQIIAEIASRSLSGKN